MVSGPGNGSGVGGVVVEGGLYFSAQSKLNSWAVSIGVLEWWSGGVLECWSDGVMECWSGGVVEFWSIGVLGVFQAKSYKPCYNYLN